jgi:hypothetical protein
MLEPFAALFGLMPWLPTNKTNDRSTASALANLPIDQLPSCWAADITWIKNCRAAGLPILLE